MLSADPWIAILHDVITNAESDEMKNLAFPQVNITGHMTRFRVTSGLSG